MKRILVACGNGIATSTVVATKIREICEENGVAVSVTQCKLLEIDSKVDDFDKIWWRYRKNTSSISNVFINRNRRR